MAARSPINQDSNVIIDYVTPGACKSDLFRDDASCKNHRVESKTAILTFACTRDPKADHEHHDLCHRPYD